MTQAPERIWASQENSRVGAWIDFEDSGYTEYVRADIAAAAYARGLEDAAKVAEARWKVWNDVNNDHEVSCDVTACENIAAAIRALIPKLEETP